MRVCPAFVDETGILSGKPEDQPVYGIGVLVVPDPTAVTNSLYRVHYNFASERQKRRNQLRREIQREGRQVTLKELDHLMHGTRHHEYKFSEITRFNLQQYIDLLNIYFSFADLQFHAVVFDRLEPQYSLARWCGDEWRAYADITRGLLSLRMDREVFVTLDYQDKPNKATLHIEDVVCQSPNVAGCMRATSETSVFLQLVDVLLGCIQFDYKDDQGFYQEASQRANEKRQLVEFVKDKTGVRRNERFLTPQRDLNAPSLFTVCRGNWNEEGFD